MKKLEEMASSSEKSTSHRMKAPNQKAIIAKIRRSLKSAAARNKARLVRKTSSVDRRLQKSSLLKSQSSFEVSIYERTLLYNNRKLAHALQNIRQENRLLQEQILELTHQKLDLVVEQADSSSQLAELQRINMHKEKLIAKLSNKFREVADVFSELQNNDFHAVHNDTENTPVGHDTIINNENSFNDKPSWNLHNAFKGAAISSKNDNPLNAGRSCRQPKLSNPFDLSVINEASEKSLNESVCRPDSKKASGVPALLSQIDSAKSRRETFVVVASRQTSDLPSPVKKLRSRIRLRRSNSFELMLRLSETPEKNVDDNKVESTICFPVDMEMTTVLNTPITGSCMDGPFLVQHPEKASVSNTTIGEINPTLSTINELAQEGGPSANFDVNVIGLKDENSPLEKGRRMSGEPKNFSFITERLSNRNGKRSAASTRSSSQSIGLLEDKKSSLEFEACLNVSSNASDGFLLPPDLALENCKLMEMPEQVLALQCSSSSPEAVIAAGSVQQTTNETEAVQATKETEAVRTSKKMETVDARCVQGFENNVEDGDKCIVFDTAAQQIEVPKQKRVSFVGTPQDDLPRKGKGKSRGKTASRASAVKADKDVLSARSNTKATGNPVCSKRSSGKASWHPDSSERSILGEVSPNRTRRRPSENSPSHGKPYSETPIKTTEGDEHNLQQDDVPLGRQRRTRTHVVYKEMPLNKKMRR